MLLAGFVKLTLIDYPNKLASVCFTQGCNFNCPFCHNPKQIQVFNPNKDCSLVSVFEKNTALFLDFLKTRKNKLEGVCITGGEPTLQPDLIEFVEKIKNMGFLVKLDSQGSNPNVLEKLISQRLIDYIAMDIKHSYQKYFLAVGKKTNIKKIKESIEIIKNSNIDYEFRTTVVPGIHKLADFYDIADLILKNNLNSSSTIPKTKKIKYFLQEFRNEKTNKPNSKYIDQNKNIDLNEIKKILDNYSLEVGIRWNN
jgi:pyruvate formate lyase activating enzyme